MDSTLQREMLSAGSISCTSFWKFQYGSLLTKSNESDTGTYCVEAGHAVVIYTLSQMLCVADKFTHQECRVLRYFI